MKSKIYILVLIAALVSTSGCESIDEADDLAKAQKCLDEVPQSNPPAAEACLESIQKYTTQQANILKCSIYHTSGGLMENKLVKGALALIDDSISNKEAAFMAVLSLDNPNITSGLTKAQTADGFCQQTGIPSLKYLSGIIVAGTALAKTMADLSIAAIDVNSPSSIDTALDSLMAQCAPSGAPNPTCNNNLQTIGEAVVTLSSSYCDNNNAADSEVCQDINDAVAAAGNNATDIGQALLCYMNGKTYNSGSQQCN